MMSKILAPATLAFAMSGMKVLFCPTPMAAKITEKMAIKMLFPFSMIPSWKSIPANQKVNPSTIMIMPLPMPSKNDDFSAFSLLREDNVSNFSEYFSRKMLSFPKDLTVLMLTTVSLIRDPMNFSFS